MYNLWVCAMVVVVLLLILLLLLMFVLLLLLVALEIEVAQLPVLLLIPCECWIFNRLAILLLQRCYWQQILVVGVEYVIYKVALMNMKWYGGYWRGSLQYSIDRSSQILPLFGWLVWLIIFLLLFKNNCCCCAPIIVFICTPIYCYWLAVYAPNIVLCTDWVWLIVTNILCPER